jgi:flotillin
VSGTIGDLHVDKLTVIGKNGTANGHDFATTLVRTNEQIKAATGVDLPAMLKERLGATSERAVGVKAE